MPTPLTGLPARFKTGRIYCGRCRQVVKEVEPPYVRYFADTNYGSSGSPVFLNMEVNKVWPRAAIHPDDCDAGSSVPQNFVWICRWSLSIISAHPATGRTRFTAHDLLHSSDGNKYSELSVWHRVC